MARVSLAPCFTLLRVFQYLIYVHVRASLLHSFRLIRLVPWNFRRMRWSYHPYRASQEPQLSSAGLVSVGD